MAQVFYRFNVDGYKIPKGSIVRLLKWGKKRHVLVDYRGEHIRTQGQFLRKVKGTINIGGPASRCPECLCDYYLGKIKCSGCDNDYKGWFVKGVI